MAIRDELLAEAMAISELERQQKAVQKEFQRHRTAMYAAGQKNADISRQISERHDSLKNRCLEL